MAITRLAETRELLWSNPDGTADFAAQTVQLGTRDYDLVEIWWKGHKSYNASACTVDRLSTLMRGSIAWVESASNWTFAWTRGVTGDYGQVVFRDAYEKNLATNNAAVLSNERCIPMRIYGVKLA